MRLNEERIEIITRDKETDLALMVRSKLEVDPLDNSMMVYLRAEDKDPEIAQAIVNAYATSYRAFNLEYKRKVILDANGELNQLMQRLTQERDVAEREVYEFETTYSVGTFENKKAAIKTKLDELTRKVTELEISRVELQARLKELKPYDNVKDLFGLGARDLLDDAILRSLQQQFVDLANQKLDLSQTYGERHPKLASLQPRLDLLEKTLRSQIRARIKSVKRELNQVESTLASLTASLEEVRLEETRINGIWLQYEPLLAKRTAANKFYDTVRHRQTETSLSAQVETKTCVCRTWRSVPPCRYGRDRS